MAKMGKFQVKGLKELQKELGRMHQDRDRFLESCAKELAARLLRLVVKRTPVGDYHKEIKVTAKRDSKNHKKGDVYTKKINPSGKQGGTLRRGWISETQEEAEAKKSKPQVPEIQEYVTVDGDGKPIRGTRMRHEVVGGILNFFVNYDAFTYRTEEQTAMGELQSNISVKEGD